MADKMQTREQMLAGLDQQDHSARRPDAAGTEWVLVPRAPTGVMKEAGDRALVAWVAPAMHSDAAYQAMLDAAPPAPHLAASADVRRQALEEAARWHNEYYRAHIHSASIIRALVGSSPSASGTPQRPHLFTDGAFTAASGTTLSWKIECDALTDADWATLASIIASRVRFSAVEGVPTGGLKLAAALAPYASSEGPLLIVDDVLTTGGSLERLRAGREAIGFVVFARGPLLPWVRAVWQFEFVGSPSVRRWRHKKRGTTYVEVSREFVQAFADETMPAHSVRCAANYEKAQVQGIIRPGERAVFYRSEHPAGTLWCRAEREFTDGRFEEIALPVARARRGRADRAGALHARHAGNAAGLDHRRQGRERCT